MFKKNRGLIILGVVVMFLISLVGTYAYYTATASNNNVISVTAASANLQLTVTKSAGGGNLVPQIGKYLQSALTGTNGTSCIDANGNTVCQVYTITIKNTGTATAVLTGTLELTAANMNNLKWEELSGVSTRNSSPITHGINGNVITNSLTLAKNATKTYYIAIWIEEKGVSQSDSGSFNGTISFNYANGDGVTSNFGPTAGDTLAAMGISTSSVKTLASDYWNTAVNDTDTDTTNDSGLYSYTEDSKLNYFYRGHVNNNWVLFGGIYWRIVRITDTGEIRMIYNGTTAPTSSDAIVKTSEWGINDNATVAFQNYLSDGLGDTGAFYPAEASGYQYTIGYEHGNDNDSNIKDIIDTWYTNTLKTNYGTYISTSKYCYDRNSEIIGDKYSKVEYFGSYINFIAKGATGPQIYCSNASDNYHLKSALLSADEAAIAGLSYNVADSSNYLSSGRYWLGSPFSKQDYSSASVFAVNNNILWGTGVGTTVSNTKARPVISLKSPSGIVSGTTGTYDHPYQFTW